MWCNSASDYARALILVSNHMFLGMGNPLRYFSGASDQFEDQKQGEGLQYLEDRQNSSIPELISCFELVGNDERSMIDGL